jgi:hypothetical protein
MELHLLLKSFAQLRKQLKEGRDSLWNGRMYSQTKYQMYLIRCYYQKDEEHNLNSTKANDKLKIGKGHG